MRETLAAATIRTAPANAPDASDERRKERDPQRQRQHERRSAIGADPGVTHDLELALDRRPAAEPVRDIGQGILVHGSGRDDERRSRKHGRRPGRKREAERDQEGDGAGRADQRPGDRQRRREIRHHRRPVRVGLLESGGNGKAGPEANGPGDRGEIGRHGGSAPIGERQTLLLAGARRKRACTASRGGL